MPEIYHPDTGCRIDALFGEWLIDSNVLDHLVVQAGAIDLKWLAEQNAKANTQNNLAKIDAALESPSPITPPPPKPYVIHDGGVAEIVVKGQTTKYPTSFQSILGGTSTLRVQEALRAAIKDDSVKTILMTYECPGGTVAGAWDLVDDLRAANAAKGVHSRIQDQGTSGGYLFAAQGGSIAANANAQIGSIGVLSMLIDSSKRLEKDGIRVIPITRGKFKAVGLQGAPVSKEDVKDAERRVAEIGDLFDASIAAPRRLTEAFVRGLEAKVFIASEAKKLNLIDRVETRDETLARARDFASKRVTVLVVKSESDDPALSPPALPTKGTTIMPKDLLATIRQAANQPTMSEEDAERWISTTHATDEALTALRTQLAAATAKIKEPTPAPILAGCKKNALAAIKVATKGATVTDAQAEQLVAMVESHTETICVPNDKGDSILDQFLAAAALAPTGIKSGTETAKQLKQVDPGPGQGPGEFDFLDKLNPAQEEYQLGGKKKTA